MELRGTLTDFSLEAILGLIHSGHKTGTLRLDATTPLHMQRSIEVSFADGEVTGARCGTLQGLDAMREAAICAEGSFEFTVDAALSAREDGGMGTMETVLALIAETRARMAGIAAALPEADAGLKHGMPEGDTVRLSPEEFRVLAVFRDGMTIETIVSSSAAPTIDSLRVIQQLRERGLLEAGPAVRLVDQMTYAGVLSLVEYVGGQAGVDIFNRYFRPGTPVEAWARAVPGFRSAFQALVGTDRTNEVIAGLREITG
ncbi:MAG TPA: DUF4388 domain-containing protein [Candidatus Cryosericum sp.]|nr:DUF4388 domain-containing protein [Candidatus Cryosericum sp.]